MSLARALTDIGNTVYDACALYEQLEYTDQVFGNGHHMRQYAAKAAMHILFKQWRNDAEKREYAEQYPEYKDLL